MALAAERAGPSPRARGALAMAQLKLSRLGTIPAGAGSTHVALFTRSDSRYSPFREAVTRAVAFELFTSCGSAVADAQWR